jgi:hypothetical protein
MLGRRRPPPGLEVIMRKLSLDLNELVVESFEPLPDALALAGTVRGRVRDSDQEGCSEIPEHGCTWSEWVHCTDKCSGDEDCKTYECSKAATHCPTDKTCMSCAETRCDCA